MERQRKEKLQEQHEIDRLIEEIDETNIFAALLNRAKKLFSRPLVEGIFYGIGGAITALTIKKLFKGPTTSPST